MESTVADEMMRYSLPPPKEWYDQGDTSEADGSKSSDYVDGWNDALKAVAKSSDYVDALKAVALLRVPAPVGSKMGPPRAVRAVRAVRRRTSFYVKTPVREALLWRAGRRM
jgi:hypothetical protein